jgi:hypothetical protein
MQRVWSMAAPLLDNPAAPTGHSTWHCPQKVQRVVTT